MWSNIFSGISQQANISSGALGVGKTLSLVAVRGGPNNHTTTRTTSVHNLVLVHTFCLCDAPSHYLKTKIQLLESCLCRSQVILSRTHQNLELSSACGGLEHLNEQHFSTIDMEQGAMHCFSFASPH